jgi:hypothetical protein
MNLETKKREFLERFGSISYSVNSIDGKICTTTLSINAENEIWDWIEEQLKEKDVLFNRPDIIKLYNKLHK